MVTTQDIAIFKKKTAAILKLQDGGQGGGGAWKKCQHWFSDSQDSKLSKNV